ncbi:MAG: hypothetical protein ACKV19_22600 [Verrucomicrobiales bacterium]
MNVSLSSCGRLLIGIALFTGGVRELPGQKFFAGTDPVIDEGGPDSWTNILYINESHPFDFSAAGQSKGVALEFQFWADREIGTLTPVVAEVVAPNEFIVRAIGTTRRGGVDWVEPGLQVFAFQDGGTPEVRQGWVAGFLSATAEGEEGGSPIPFASSNIEGWLTGTASGSGTPRLEVDQSPTLGESGTNPDAYGFRRYAFQITATLAEPRPPTDIIATPSVIRAGLAIGATVATLSAIDPNAGDTHTFTLVAGAGATDNAQFAIQGALLKAAAPVGGDGTRYSIRVRAADGGGLSYERSLELVALADRPPESVRLDPGSIISLQPAGSSVAQLVAVDANIVQGDTHTYQLVQGEGGEDNTFFAIEEDKLILLTDPEPGRVYRVRVRATDSTGLFREERFSVPVLWTIGNALTPRTDASSDTATVPILYTNGLGMPGPGTVGAVSLPLQAAYQRNLVFHMLQLRPTGVSEEFDVVADSGPMTVTGDVGGLVTLSFPNGPMVVQQGDLFFHYGRGIPFDANVGNALPIWYPCPVLPEAGTPLNLAFGNPDFPLRDDLQRDYAWAVHFSPGAATELRIVAQSLDLQTRLMTLTWTSRQGVKYRIRGSSDLKTWGENVETDIPAGAGAQTSRTFGPVPLPGPTYYRVEESP